MQSQINSQPVKSLVNIVLQEFTKFIINNAMAEELYEVKLERPSKYNEG